MFEGKGLHSAEKEKAHDAELLLETHAEFQDRHYGKDQNSNIDQEVNDDGAKKELVVIDVADCIRDTLIPDRLCRDATENQHESPEEPPNCRYNQQCQYRNPNNRELKHSPVERQNGYF